MSDCGVFEEEPLSAIAESTGICTEGNAGCAGLKKGVTFQARAKRTIVAQSIAKRECFIKLYRL
jgi:hypothetical protein